MADTILLDAIMSISGVNPRKCMRCGKCSGACPAYDEMEYHPPSIRFYGGKWPH